MTAANAFFYLFSAIAVASAFMVISARNPVHSVLFLILAFVNAAGLFLLLGAEFLALILIVVYVGAVAVLFLFVIMMLDVDFAELKQGFLQYLPIGALIGGVVLVELALVVGSWTVAPAELRVAASPADPNMSNTMALGRVLYTQYFYFFQAAGLVLLTAMIGSIVLTLRHKPGIKRQNITAQNRRNPHEAVTLQKVPSRAGLSS
jgi:NADH-quinone oxidoreductase subunit J